MMNSEFATTATLDFWMVKDILLEETTTTSQSLTLTGIGT